MTHPFDVPASALLPRVAAELKTRQLVNPPAWAAFVKTGVSRQQAPTQTGLVVPPQCLGAPEDLPEGTRPASQRLSAEYGGRKDRGSAPYHARSGSRSILREIVQQLEKSGLLKTNKNRGRQVSPQG